MNNYTGLAVKQYFKHFKVIYIILAIALTAFIIVKIRSQGENYYPESTNSQRVYGAQRVFDNADQLSDYQEAELEAYIHKAEQRTGLDIVIVTLNESLKDYAMKYRSEYSDDITPDMYVRVYADNFWESSKFGYNCPQVLDGGQDTGDGVILVDNIYREDETGKIYSWMGTTGKAELNYSEQMISDALDAFYENVDSDYAQACKDFVDKVVWDSIGMKSVYNDLYKGFIPYFATIVVTLIYILANKKSKTGDVTTTAESYITGAGVHFLVSDDVFLRKSVTKHYNPPSSGSSGSGGGGGHHISGGGGSHGGGGHSR